MDLKRNERLIRRIFWLGVCLLLCSSFEFEGREIIGSVGAFMAIFGAILVYVHVSVIHELSDGL
jgi:hypothetical protein